jgi:hypothetical protein
MFSRFDFVTWIPFPFGALIGILRNNDMINFVEKLRFGLALVPCILQGQAPPHPLSTIHYPRSTIAIHDPVSQSPLPLPFSLALSLARAVCPSLTLAPPPAPSLSLAVEQKHPPVRGALRARAKREQLERV